MRNSQRGISVIEVLFSIAIMGVIFAIVANNYYSQNKRYLAVTQASTQIHLLANVSYEWQAAQAQPDFTGISLTVLQKAGLLPKTDNYSQIDPWGGPISVAADTDKNYVRITLPKIPSDACANLRNRMLNVAHSQSSASECAGGSYYISM